MQDLGLEFGVPDQVALSVKSVEAERRETLVTGRTFDGEEVEQFASGQR